MQIYGRNTLASENEKTNLTGQVAAGTNVLPWKNPSAFSPSWAVQLGKTGDGQSEIVLLTTSTPAGTMGTTTANTLYSHPTDTPIYAIKYDQMVFEVSTSGTAGTALPITNGTVTIQANSPLTVFDHTTGSSTYAYKTYFRNSVLNATSSESSWLTSAGFNFYSLGKLRQRVKGKLWNAAYLNDDLLIDDWLNEYLQKMNNAMVDVNEDYGLGTTSVSFALNTELGTITDSNFRGQIKRVWYQNGSGTFQASKMDSNSYSPTKIFVDTYPYYYMQGDSVIGRKPIDSAGTFQIEYPKNQPLLVEDTDEVPVPMQNYTTGFVDYAYAQALRKDNKSDIASEMEQRAEANIQRFKTDIAPRLTTGPTFVSIQEEVPTDDGVWM